MKRSEMVKRIVQFIDSNDEPTTVEQAATLFLSLVELHGMQPPTITILPGAYNRTDGTYGFEVNEWEPENE